MRSTEFAWMAGIVDMKGRIHRKTHAHRRTHQVTLGVETKETAVIERLSRMTGTQPEMRSARALSDMIRRGCTEHCPEPHIHVDEHLSWPKFGRWTISGAGLVVVLTNLSPFIQVDRGYAAVIDEVVTETVVEGRGSTAILASVNRLQGLGWTIPEPYAKALEERLLASLQS